MDKIPFPALVAAFAVAIVWMIIFKIYALTPEVVGVFIVSALIFGGVFWYLKHRRARGQPPARSGTPE